MKKTLVGKAQKIDKDNDRNISLLLFENVSSLLCLAGLFKSTSQPSFAYFAGRKNIVFTACHSNNSLKITILTRNAMLRPIRVNTPFIWVFCYSKKNTQQKFGTFRLCRYILSIGPYTYIYIERKKNSCVDFSGHTSRNV